MAHLNNLIMTQFYFSTLPHLKYIHCDKSINLLMHHFKYYSYIDTTSFRKASIGQPSIGKPSVGQVRRFAKYVNS